MVNQSAAPGRRRTLGRAGVLVGAVVWFLLSSSPATHADEGGLLDDATQIVEAATEQAVEPVVQAAESAVPQPVQPAVEPAVKQVVEPVVRVVEPAVKQVEPAVKQVVEPVVRVVEPAVKQAVQPVVQAVEPVKESTQVPVAPEVPSTGGPSDSRHADAAAQNRAENRAQSGARHVDAAAKGRPGERRHSKTADRTFVEDLPPRQISGPGILGHAGASDNQSAGQSQGDVFALTNALMHLYAGLDVPAHINAGLWAGMDSARTASTVPLVLGLLLGSLSLVLLRRRLGDPR